MAKSNPTITKPSAPQPRFQIAARLGGFKDTITIPDPLGTSARFTIYRAGCNAHKEWSRGQMDTNPIIEQIVLGLDVATPTLTDDEKETVETARDAVDRDDTARVLVPVIDRLISTTVERQMQKEATRRAVQSGRLKPSDMFLQGQDEQLADGLFTLKTWEDMPAEDGSIIPFSVEAAKNLLTNDTPLEDAGIDDLVLAVPEWIVTLTKDADAQLSQGESVDADESTKPTTTTKIIIPGLTLGRAYLLHLLAASNNRTLFRNQVMDAAAKNFETPSDGNISSGGGSEGTAN